jgi:diguanylate cyclase (GGDEF)-like protein
MAGSVLVVDNSKFFANLVASAVTGKLGMAVRIADSLAAAQRIITAEDISIVISGLVLADASGDAVVDFFTSRKLPLVVATAVFDEPTRERILSRPVVDYVLKDAPTSVDYLVWLVGRIARNRRVGALVVDDSPSCRGLLAHHLTLYGFRVVEAGNGLDGLAALKADRDIRLVVTDYEMPGMDGVEMTRRIRAEYSRDKLAIIGLSGSVAAYGLLSARFIKNGANDFLTKPYQREELLCRVAQNIETQEHVAQLRDLATRDHLTGLFNRRQFFECGRKLHADMLAGRRKVSVAMLDIDFFKRVNDTYGHDVGDIVLKDVARILDGGIAGDDLVARFGGEEFCLLAVDKPAGGERAFFNAIREAVAARPVMAGEREIAVTASIGVCTIGGESLESMLSAADRALYRAKEKGRNRVEVEF